LSLFRNVNQKKES